MLPGIHLISVLSPLRTARRIQFESGEYVVSLKSFRMKLAWTDALLVPGTTL